MTPTPASLIAELHRIHSGMARVDETCAGYLSTIPDDQQASARNLLHYLALRSHDLRQLQPLLASHGLSSLGRTESHVRHGLETVMKVLHGMEGTPWNGLMSAAPLTKDAGEVLLAAHTDALLGPAPDGRTVRIMVTMPAEAGSDYMLIRDLVGAGMDCMRINCAHDDIGIWERMIDHLTRANRELSRACRLSMDIAGPKLRTGPLEQGPRVLKIKPRRDALGGVTRPAVVALGAASHPHAVATPVDAVLSLDAEPPASVRPDDTIAFEDARGRTRHLHVRACQGGMVIAELERTAYVVSGTPLRFGTASGTSTRRVVNVPALSESLLLKRGETLLLTPESCPGPARPSATITTGSSCRRASGFRCPRCSRTSRPVKPCGSTTARSAGSCGRSTRTRSPWRSPRRGPGAAACRPKRASTSRTPICGCRH